MILDTTKCVWALAYPAFAKTLQDKAKPIHLLNHGSFTLPLLL
jgi:hypothetical protein